MAQTSYSSLSWKTKLYLFLEDETSGRFAYIFGNFITFSILCSIVVVCVETMDGPNHYTEEGADVRQAMYPFLASDTTYGFFEIIFTIIFTGELALRVLAAECFLWSTKQAERKAEVSKRLVECHQGYLQLTIFYLEYLARDELSILQVPDELGRHSRCASLLHFVLDP